MEIAFDAIGIEITNEAAFNNLAEDVERRGEASHLARGAGVLHGRCLKLGEGLEIWTVLYESARTGEVAHIDCRPAFRARRSHKISPLILTEAHDEGKAIIHGFIAETDTEVLFELQNLTEVGADVFKQNSLQVGLCGLAYKAEISDRIEQPFWKSYDEIALTVGGEENAWSLCGQIIAFQNLRNSFSGSNLYWLHLDLGELKLEILVNRRSLPDDKIKIGKFVRAEVWLQGHVLNQTATHLGYEGADWSERTIDFWKHFKRKN